MLCAPRHYSLRFRFWQSALHGAVEQHLQGSSRSLVVGAVHPVQRRNFRNVIFTAHGESDAGERSGNVRSVGEHHGGLHLKLEKHPNHGGSGAGTNPEELLACGYAASFNAALRQSAATTGVNMRGSRVNASVSLGVEQGEASVGTAPQLGLRIQVRASIAGVDEATAHRLAQLAQACCPFSRALHGGAEVMLDVAAVENVFPLAQEESVSQSAPKQDPASRPNRHGATPRVLIVGRKADIVDIMLRECDSLGLEALGATSNDEVEVLLHEEGPFDACAIGFRYLELPALQQILDAEGVKHRSMPPGTKYLSNTLEMLGVDISKGDADTEDDF